MKDKTPKDIAIAYWVSVALFTLLAVAMLLAEAS